MGGHEDLDLASNLFAECFEDGALVLVEPHCATWGLVPAVPGVVVNWKHLQRDLDLFATDYQVELSLTENKSYVILRGPQSAVAQARAAANDLLNQYFSRSKPCRATPKQW